MRWKHCGLSRRNSEPEQSGGEMETLRTVPEEQRATAAPRPEALLFTGWGSGRYALEKGFPGLRVSDAETLSLQKSAKSSVKNTELALLRQLYF